MLQFLELHSDQNSNQATSCVHDTHGIPHAKIPGNANHFAATDDCALADDMKHRIPPIPFHTIRFGRAVAGEELLLLGRNYAHRQLLLR
eukprot:gene6665-9439_t